MAFGECTFINICKYTVVLCVFFHVSIEAASNTRINQLNAIDGPRWNGVHEDKAFICKSGKSIWYKWLCDGEHDCIDGDDESPAKCNVTCSTNEFQCGNGPCIPKEWVCDKDVQCNDESDEHPDICKDHSPCSSGLFQCDSTICIPNEWKCDGKDDCPDGLDEEHCQKNCGSTEFTCGDGTCIDKAYFCDGEPDCTDLSDEKSCNREDCSLEDFKCPSENKCIHKGWVCDGDNDCEDGADEKGCVYEDQSKHPEKCNSDTQWLCADKSKCLHVAVLCDGQPDCLDGSDEKADFCKNHTCRADQYQCKNRQCIAGKKQCDGEFDCADNSDEEDCIHRKTCNVDEFDCGYGHCIGLSEVCDGKPDCPGHEDEPKDMCHVDECLLNNGGCSHGCVDDAIGHHCTCRPGYSLVNNRTCADIDECKIEGMCSHKCINLEGSFRCECFVDYVPEPSNPTFCKATLGPVSLLFSKRSDIRKLALDRHAMSPVVDHTNRAGAMDYLFKTAVLFWMENFNRTNITYSILYKAPISAGFHKTVVIGDGILKSDGLAVDWIYDRVYWTDAVKNTIEVADLDGGSRKTIVEDDVDDPRSIAVNPVEGWMFWSDWRSNRIERAGMDGSHRSTIIFQGVKWPNGITLDLVKRRIYWVDASLHYLASANYDGSDRRVVLKSLEYLYQPYSLSVFEDTVFWADWGKQAIFGANKFNGSGIKDFAHTIGHDPMIVQVYHPLKQPIEINFCIKEENPCSHMCFPAPRIGDRSPKISCSCPDHMRLDKDSVTCIQDVPSTQPPAAEISPDTINVHETVVEIEFPEESLGYVTVVFTIVTSIVLAGVAVLLCVVYRHYIHRNTFSMNFENLIYKKTTTTEDQPTSKSYGGYKHPPASTEMVDESRVPLNTESQTTETV